MRDENGTSGSILIALSVLELLAELTQRFGTRVHAYAG
jgi:hypothetical protein